MQGILDRNFNNSLNITTGFTLDIIVSKKDFKSKNSGRINFKPKEGHERTLFFLNKESQEQAI